jgi:predicted nucleic acid-binding protein
MILDTSVLVDLVRGNADVEKRVKEYEEKGEPLRVSTVSAFELYYGAYRSSRVMENLRLIKDLLKSLELISYDEKASAISGAILAELRQRGEAIDIRDLFISATAMSVEDKIATRNIRHFNKVRDLEVELW